MRTAPIAVALLLTFGAARAQAPVPAPTDEARQLASELLEIEDLNGSLQRMVANVELGFQGLKTGMSSEERKGFEDAMGKVYIPTLRATSGSYRSAVVDIYATTYSVDEMRGIIAFDRSQLGERLTALRPELERRIAEAQVRWTRTAFDATLEQMRTSAGTSHAKP